MFGQLIATFTVLLAGSLWMFGTLALDGFEVATWSAIDAELESQAAAIAGAMEFDHEEAHVEPGQPDPHKLGKGWELDLSPSFRERITRAGWFAILTRESDGPFVLLHAEGALPKDFSPMDVPNVWVGFPVIALSGSQRQITHPTEVASRSVTILISRDTAQEQAALRANSRSLIAGGIGLVLMGWLFAFSIVRSQVRPLRAAALEAAAIGESELGKRLSTKSVPQELQGVVTAFNGTLDRLQAAFERQAQFTADASHELRTPVAIIRTQAEAALKRDRSAEDYKASLEACARAAVRMTAIVEGLLTLARADAGDGVSLATCDLKAVTEEAVAPLTEQAAADGITVKCNAAPATVAGDEGLLGEVVTNLVTNAVRYNKPGGTVDVSLSVPNGTVELRVSDTGAGIPAASLPHLFERFYRVDPARSREEGGSGLGLAITKWIVEAHKGAIEVESTEGEGTTFTVRLPAPTTRP